MGTGVLSSNSTYMRKILIAVIGCTIITFGYNNYALAWGDDDDNNYNYNNDDDDSYNYNNDDDDSYNYNSDDDDNNNYNNDDDYNGGGGYGDDDDDDIPLDGGLSFLALAGAGYGIKKIADNKAKNKEDK